MQQNKIHIVSFDVPFPPDYGGVIDVYYRAKALKEQGVYIILHCFEYGRGTSHDFSEICDEIHYYKRKRSILKQFSRRPFIINTRDSEELKNRLLADGFPILLEGMHCCAILEDQRFDARSIFVRVHNIEQHYYRQLARFESNFFKKSYFRLESYRLGRLENILKKASHLFCLTEADFEHHRNINLNCSVWRLGIEIPENFPDHEQKFQALFHGNLSVHENADAVKFLLNCWRKNKLEIPLIIAGKNPSEHLTLDVLENQVVELIENPTAGELDKLLSESQFSLLISCQQTGMKVKLLHALLKGRRCIATKEMMHSSGLDEFVLQIHDADELPDLLVKSNVQGLEELQKRRAYLLNQFDPAKNAVAVLKILFPVKKS